MREEPEMEFIDVVAVRRSVRAYTPTPLDRATIEKLIHAAIQAPSAVNTQPGLRRNHGRGEAEGVWRSGEGGCSPPSIRRRR